MIGINKLLSEKNIIEVITVKKNRFTEFFKGKGYYVLLFVGVIAIAAVAIIGAQLSSNKKNEDQNYVDLNDADDKDNIAADDKDNELADNSPISDGVVNNENNSDTDVATNDNEGQEAADNDDSIELEGYAEDSDSNTEQADASEAEDVAQGEEEQPDAVETTGSTVEDEDAAETLSFTADDDLLWPVSGNVIMNYSMDHTIYFATLMKYKCNPAIIIDAEVGTEVKSAAKGVITSIDYNEETGHTITTDIGNGFSCIYGQLNEDSISKLKVGDVLNEGDVVGTIEKPTKYYSVEGSNLYFQVMNNDQTVNPMLYLQ